MTRSGTLGGWSVRDGTSLPLITLPFYSESDGRTGEIVIKISGSYPSASTSFMRPPDHLRGPVIATRRPASGRYQVMRKLSDP
jgi:hypothetical protein